jgi:hypothetical protein
MLHLQMHLPTRQCKETNLDIYSIRYIEDKKSYANCILGTPTIHNFTIYNFTAVRK